MAIESLSLHASKELATLFMQCAAEMKNLSWGFLTSGIEEKKKNFLLHSLSLSIAAILTIQQLMCLARELNHKICHCSTGAINKEMWGQGEMLMGMLFPWLLALRGGMQYIYHGLTRRMEDGVLVRQTKWPHFGKIAGWAVNTDDKEQDVTKHF